MLKTVSISKFLFLILFLTNFSFSQDDIDTSYSAIAPSRLQKMVVSGKPPLFTIQLSGYYHIGLMDLAATDNTSFQQDDFTGGRNFGTRYGFGVSLIGKLSLHKKGNIRLTFSPSYSKFLSDFIIKSQPNTGKVYYDVFSGSIGLENNFTPDKRFKTYVGFEVIVSSIGGEATLKQVSPEEQPKDIILKIKNGIRIGAGLNFGFEYAFTNAFGINLGIRLTHANILLKDSKDSTNSEEIFLNDEHVSPEIPFSGWKQFFYMTYNLGFNFYIRMKTKK